jgi:putative transcription factor
MPCEMCGKEVPRLKKVQIGSSVLEVCNECAKFGSDMATEAPKGEPIVSGTGAVAAPPVPIAYERAPQKQRDALSRGEIELVEDYSKRISKARQKKDWTQEDLAKRMNEKKSVVSRLETGEMRPSDKLVKKLENELDIKLMERMEFQVEASKKSKGTGGVTLGDLIKMEK